MPSTDSPDPARAIVAPPKTSRTALLLYVFIAIVILSPFRSVDFRPTGDLVAHIGGIVDARNALEEGQFPIRVAPYQNERSRYAIFQFYGNFPYTAPGLLHWGLGLDPYQAWKVFMLALLTGGGFAVYKLSLRVTRRPLASMIAGAVFMTAPYQLTDLHARGAYTELVALNVLPGLAYWLLRAFSGRKVSHIAVAAVFWALLALSHNITYLYGSTFLGLFFLLFARPSRKYVGRMLRLGAAFILHLALIAWYVVPQLSTLNALDISAATGSPMYSSEWLSLKILLAGSLKVRAGLQPNFGLQVGWPSLAAAGLTALAVLFIGLAALFRRRRGPLARWRGAVAWRTLVLFALAFFVVWSPVDFWKHLPELFRFIQFTYRNLVLTALWGALLFACALSLWLRRDLRGWQAVVCLLGLGAAVGSYLPPRGPLTPGQVQHTMLDPRMGIEWWAGGLADYALSNAVYMKTTASLFWVNLAQRGPGFTFDGRLRNNAKVKLPTPSGPCVFVIEGIAPAEHDRTQITIAFDDEEGSFYVAPGPFRLQFFPPAAVAGTTAEVTINAVSADEEDEGAPVSPPLSKIAFESPPGFAARLADGTSLVPPSDVTRLNVEPNDRQRFRVDVGDEPAAVMLPVLYYPRLLRVQVDNKRAAYENVGRFVMVRVTAGAHKVQVLFAGVAWANVVSLIGWGGVVVVGAGSAFRNWRRRPEPKLIASRSALKPAVVGGCALLIGAALPPLAKEITGRLGAKLTIEVDANRSVGAGFEAAQAFDGDRATSWAANGGTTAVLSVVPSRPATLKRMEFDSRETSLWECWRTIELRYSLRGQPISVQTFDLPDAESKGMQAITPAPVKADRVDIHFSNPVTETPNGATVPADRVNPGYKEIRMEWVER